MNIKKLDCVLVGGQYGLVEAANYGSCLVWLANGEWNVGAVQAVQLGKESISVDDVVVFFKGFEPKPGREDVNEEFIGETGLVVAKSPDGYIGFVGNNFRVVTWIPEECLFKLNKPATHWNAFSVDDELFLIDRQKGVPAKISWDSFKEYQLGRKCRIIEVLRDGEYEFPVYRVEFGDGTSTLVYEGWLSESPIENKPIEQDVQPELAKECPGCDLCEMPDLTEANIREDNGVLYVVKDGVRMFETGAVRSDNVGKPRFDLISPLAEKWLAEELSKNGGTYGNGNYMLGIPESVCIESLQRHLNVVKIGLMTGDQSQVDEAVNVLCNAMFLAHTIMLKREGLYRPVLQLEERVNLN